MEGFFEQLDRFLSALTPGGFGSLTQDLHRRDVLTQVERRQVDECLSDAGKEAARESLIGLLRTKRDVAKLRAVSQALQAFQLLYKDTKSKLVFTLWLKKPHRLGFLLESALWTSV